VRRRARAQGLSTVYATAVAEALSPAGASDGQMVDAQFAGPKAALRPVYDLLVKRAKAPGRRRRILPTGWRCAGRATSTAS
jgi:hypothetical protein